MVGPAIGLLKERIALPERKNGPPRFPFSIVSIAGAATGWAAYPLMACKWHHGETEDNPPFSGSPQLIASSFSPLLCLCLMYMDGHPSPNRCKGGEQGPGFPYAEL
jgi:hypothetical protein